MYISRHVVFDETVFLFERCDTTNTTKELVVSEFSGYEEWHKAKGKRLQGMLNKSVDRKPQTSNLHNKGFVDDIEILTENQHPQPIINNENHQPPKLQATVATEEENGGGKICHNLLQVRKNLQSWMILKINH